MCIRDRLYEEALGNLNSPADWETRAICEIMNTGIAVSYTHLIRRTNAGKHRRNGAGKRLLGRTATGSILTYLIYGRNRMKDKKRLNSYEDLPLVLDVADIQRIDVYKRQPPRPPLPPPVPGGSRTRRWPAPRRPGRCGLLSVR